MRVMDAYTRHRFYMQQYVQHYRPGDAKPQQPQGRTDADVLRENHKFIRDDEEDAKNQHDWEVRAAQKYYNKVASTACDTWHTPDVLLAAVLLQLYREYCIADMSRYKEGKVAMRWRVEKEVVTGKGHFVCGAKTCNENKGLRSFEVNFAYVEAGERKNALVKLRLCPCCGFQLHYKKYKSLSRSEYKHMKKLHEKAMANGGFEEDLQQQKAARDKAYGEKDRRKSREEYLQGVKKRALESSVGEQVSSKKPRGMMGGPERSTREEETATAVSEAKESTIWNQKPKAEVTKEDEFEEYFAGMFP